MLQTRQPIACRKYFCFKLQIPYIPLHGLCMLLGKGPPISRGYSSHFTQNLGSSSSLLTLPNIPPSLTRPPLLLCSPWTVGISSWPLFPSLSFQVRHCPTWNTSEFPVLNRFTEHQHIIYLISHTESSIPTKAGVLGGITEIHGQLSLLAMWH